jgi:phospholipase C
MSATAKSPNPVQGTTAPTPSRRVMAILVIVVLTAALSAPFVAEKVFPSATVWTASDVPIQHIVILMMENHAFDNYFGSYCPTIGPFCASAVMGEPAGLCVPDVPGAAPGAGCTKPFELGPSNMSPEDLAHDYNSTVRSIDGGKMDGFYEYEYAATRPFGYYNSSTIPIYWDLAEEYGLGDNFFSSAISYSLPNHWYLVSGQAPPNSVNQSAIGRNTSAYKHAYLNQSNATMTVEDLLNLTPSVSWKYYDWSLPTYQVAINAGWTTKGGSAYDYWSPLAAKAESYTQWYANHFVSRDAIFGDAANGSLPDISYVIPYPTFSDHPGTSNISSGESFVAQVVDAIESSPEWHSTALFLSWDDYGGWYDGVAPPKLDNLGLSIRVPLIVVSPYTPEGTIVHGLGYFESLLHFVEWRWNLGCITSRDCNAPLPFAYFNFNQTARAPILFPTNWTNATYPMPLQDVSQIALGCATDCQIDPEEWNTNAAQATENFTEYEAD